MKRAQIREKNPMSRMHWKYGGHRRPIKIHRQLSWDRKRKIEGAQGEVVVRHLHVDNEDCVSRIGACLHKFKKIYMSDICDVVTFCSILVNRDAISKRLDLVMDNWASVCSLLTE